MLERWSLRFKVMRTMLAAVCSVDRNFSPAAHRQPDHPLMSDDPRRFADRARTERRSTLVLSALVLQERCRQLARAEIERSERHRHRMTRFDSLDFIVK
jgi:hypothetical protein